MYRIHQPLTQTLALFLKLLKQEEKKLLGNYSMAAQKRLNAFISLPAEKRYDDFSKKYPEFPGHLLPAKHSPGEPIKKVNGTGAHPHRGVSLLTDIRNGEDDHFDSDGNHAIGNSGEAKWMKAVNGIIESRIDYRPGNFQLSAIG
ncbi:MAG: pirin family protein [Ferruginibacter sp.]